MKGWIGFVLLGLGWVALAGCQVGGPELGSLSKKEQACGGYGDLAFLQDSDAFRKAIAPPKTPAKVPQYWAKRAFSSTIASCASTREKPTFLQGRGSLSSGVWGYGACERSDQAWRDKRFQATKKLTMNLAASTIGIDVHYPNLHVCGVRLQHKTKPVSPAVWSKFLTKVQFQEYSYKQDWHRHGKDLKQGLVRIVQDGATSAVEFQPGTMQLYLGIFGLQVKNNFTMRAIVKQVFGPRSNPNDFEFSMVACKR